jgi:Zn-dependent protease with chaperone function
MREALVDGGDAEVVLSHFIAQIVLDPEQLTAVLAHERAHLAGRHHLLLAITRSLAAVAPFVPIFARGTGEVARLAEMRADDAAAGRAGGEGRVRRLAEPPAPARLAGYRLALAALTVAIGAAAVLVPVLAIAGA